MIYSYIPYVVEGPTGFTLRHKDENNKMTELGSIGGVVYVYAPNVTTQDTRLQWATVVLTDEQKELLRNSMRAKNHKNFARTKIEEIGDVYDLLADAMKLIEFNMMLTSRLAGDMWGTHPIAPAMKTIYAARNGGFLDAVAAKAITLRGDFDDMNVLMGKMMSRYTQINEIVRDNYVAEMQRVGL